MDLRNRLKSPGLLITLVTNSNSDAKRQAWELQLTMMMLNAMCRSARPAAQERHLVTSTAQQQLLEAWQSGSGGKGKGGECTMSTLNAMGSPVVFFDSIISYVQGIP